MWGLVGLAGVTGVLSGDAAARYGLGRCLATCLLVLAASVGALGLAGGSGPLVAACAAAFGASYFPVAALLLVWSGGVFRERPTAGFSVVLSSLALGSIVGPAAFGAVAGLFGLRAAFWCAAALTALSIALRPSSPDVRGAAPGGTHPSRWLVGDRDGS
jgi:predicted MFS family arabinose efflux permease